MIVIAPGLDLIKAIPKSLRGKALRLKAPQRGQERATVPVGDLGFGSGRADAVQGGEQQIVGRGRAGTRLGPEGEQQIEHARALGGEPERTGQSELQRGGREWNRSGAVLNQSGNALGRAEIGLMDDAGLTVDAGALDDVVVELVGFFLGNEGSHRG